MARITGIGGVFIRSKHKGADLTRWYVEVLGLQTESWGGAVLRWPEDTAEDKGSTVWNPADNDTGWFPGPFMINYRVENLEALVEQLKNEGVTIVDKIESFDYGKFIHILDAEGNRVELWEANDDVYEKMLNAVTK